MKKICLVSDGQPSTNPRLVKEADALFEAGYDLTVIFCQGWADWATESDKRLLAKTKWKHKSIRWSKELNPFLYQKSRFCFFLFRFLHFKGLLERREEYAVSRVYPELLKAVLGEKAGFYISHYLGGLAASARAAKKKGAKFGFGAEDFHNGETGEGAARRRKT